MQIYAAPKVHEKFIRTHTDRALQYNLEGLLDQKKSYLIDVFNTITPSLHDVKILEHVCGQYSEEEYTYQRQGIVQVLQNRQQKDKYVLREGFHEFLQGYRHAFVALHSDALTQNEYAHIAKLWNTEHIPFFGGEYLDVDSLFSTQKNFEKMIEQTPCTKKETLIIGDGGSDILPAVHADVDVLLVPRYRDDPDFDFRSLLPTGQPGATY